MALSCTINQSLDSEQGFSLLEVVIATYILVIATMGLCAALISNSTLLRTSNELSIATFAGMKKMEEIMAEDPTNVPTYCDANTPFAVAVDNKILLQADGSAAGTISYTSSSINSINVYSVTVTVRWENPNAGPSAPDRNRQVVFTNLIFEE